MKDLLFKCRSFIWFNVPVFSNKSGDIRVPYDDLKKISTEDWRAEDIFYAVESSHSNKLSHKTLSR
jgi:predicted site-specific integrase-resolvase